MGTSTISWLAGPDGKPGKVWNPVSGCSKVSQGCKHCYAERLAQRFWGERKFTDVQCHPDRLDMPLHWRKPQRIFVNSMSDLFHDDVPDEFIQRVWFTMRGAWGLDGNTVATEDRPKHTYFILTKRPARMRDFLRARYPTGFELGNVWLGVSIEDQATADERIPLLLATPAAVRWVSYEPAIGPVDFDKKEWLCRAWSEKRPTIGTYLDWIVAGGESGPGYRPDDIQWYRDLRDECVAANVPFFFKQRAGLRPGQGAELDGVVWHQLPGQ